MLHSKAPFKEEKAKPCPKRNVSGSIYIHFKGEVPLNITRVVTPRNAAVRSAVQKSMCWVSHAAVGERADKRGARNRRTDRQADLVII